jgi:tetratricopeptide (TPR) repeat protein
MNEEAKNALDSLLARREISPEEYTKTLAVLAQRAKTTPASAVDLDSCGRICDRGAVNPLEPPHTFHLSAAIGWLGLGNWQEANEELEKIAPALRAHPSVLAVRHEIYAKAEKWGMAAEIAGVLVQMRPDEPQFWIWRAYSTRRMPSGSLVQAKEILDKAETLFPEVWTIPYNLACYCAQLGRLEECQDWLKKAMAIDEKTVKRLAIDDLDLKPF